MSGKDPAGRALRFLKRWKAAGYGEARRRIREEREDAEIRQELTRPDLLTGAERKAQAETAFPEGICFNVRFLRDSGREPAAETLKSIEEQTFRNVRIEPAEAETAPEDYAVFLEPDGFLHPGALYECAKAIRNAGAEMLYTDEDYYIERPKDLFMPRLKPGYGPDSLRGCNDAGPLLVCKEALLKAAGAENFARLGENARWDATLRMAEKTDRICRIAKILYYRKAASAEEIPQPALRREEGPVPEAEVSILIPSRDHREDLKRCVDSIRERTDWSRYEIIILENNSAEEETFRYYEELKQDPRIRVIAREGEFNFSALNNMGAREAKGEYLLLLNNDTEVGGGDWIREMVRYARRPDVGAVGAKLLYADGTVQHAGIAVGVTIAAAHVHRGEPGNSGCCFGRLLYARNVSAVTGACMMVPKRVWEEAGGMDESFPVAFNDTDLCLRLREAGYLVVWTPWAELTHYESKTRGPEAQSPERLRLFTQETNRFLRKWHGALDKGDPYYNPNLTREREDWTPRI